MVSTSFSIICETAMGYKEEESDECRHVLDSEKVYLRASKLACRRTYQPWLQPSLLFKVYTYLIGCPNIFQQAQDLPRKMVKHTKEVLMRQKVMSNNELSTDDKPSKNLLEILLDVQEENDKFTEQEITDELLTIIHAGTETNAIVDSFTLLMLAMNPDIQDKVCEELKEIFTNSDRLPTSEDLHKMKFLEQCLKESLRLFSTVPLVYRRTDEDILISEGHILPAGCRISISPYGVHHDEKYYPNPKEWNPFNFDPDRVANRHPFSFIPFGTGPRTCLGNKFAMLSMKAQLSTIIRNYKITTDVKMEDVELSYDFVLRSEHGYRIKLDYRGDGSIF